jgi:carbonic anhydrase
MKFFLVTFACFICLIQPSFADTTKGKNKVSSKEAIQKLMEGNERFVKNNISYADSSEERRESIVAAQDPFAVVLGCSDSRVPVEIIFDQGLGEIFVIRTAGNAAGPDELDSIEYAVKDLNASVVLVLGHQNCGAIQAIMADKTKEIDEIAKFLINPKVPECKHLQSCITANVRHSIEEILKSPIVAPKVKSGEIALLGAYYNMDSGKVEILDTQ